MALMDDALRRSTRTSPEVRQAVITSWRGFSSATAAFPTLPAVPTMSTRIILPFANA
jgi:hypothetical protein